MESSCNHTSNLSRLNDAHICVGTIENGASIRFAVSIIKVSLLFCHNSYVHRNKVDIGNISYYILVCISMWKCKHYRELGTNEGSLSVNTSTGKYKQNPWNWRCTPRENEYAIKKWLIIPGATAHSPALRSNVRGFKRDAEVDVFFFFPRT